LGVFKGQPIGFMGLSKDIDDPFTFCEVCQSKKAGHINLKYGMGQTIMKLFEYKLILANIIVIEDLFMGKKNTWKENMTKKMDIRKD
jgi:hypothetical protein